jgi:RNA polymerase sigma-70 factor (ECF subfamily)
MHPARPIQEERHEAPEVAGSLGEVLYAGEPGVVEPEAEWVRLVRAIAAGDARALHSLYERAHRLVFTASFRITGNRESAEEVMLEVFYDVWRRAAAYEPAGGPVLGWIMNQARSRAIDRLRYEQRKKRTGNPEGDPLAATVDNEPYKDLLARDQERVVREALIVLSADERRAIETAYFSGLTYAATAAALDEPVGTIKTRIRSALEKLRKALAERRGDV